MDYKGRNLTLMTDLYQLTMMYGYFKEGMMDTTAVFDLFFRELPGKREYAVMAGTESVVDYINNLKFEKEDVDYLRSLNLFDEDFLKYIENFRFTGEIYAMPEGTVVFPREPLIRVKAPITQAQLVETTLLNLVNHQTLIATKASRVKYSAGNRTVMEFGLRRAQGPDAGTLGARAAVIGGCDSTSNVAAGKLFDIGVAGTHAHSWVMSFPSEIDAFRAYARMFPDTCLLLVDTYDTLKSGVPNAIKVFDELKEQGHKPLGVRLDSGDLAYMSKQARKLLDDAGYKDAIICASSDLDEYVIRDLIAQGACIDSFGVGTRLITSEDLSALGGVYKLAAEIEGDKVIPKIKISENPIKTTNPGYKKVYRIYDNHNMALADLITLDHEQIDEKKPLTLCHPVYRYKKMTVTDYTARELLVPLFIDGKQVYELPTMNEIRDYAKREKDSFWDEYKRLLNPHVYKVDLSDELYNMKQEILINSKKNN